MNVFDFAMKMETDAEAFYKQVAEKSKVQGIRKIFLDLAADEKKHFQMFQALKAQTQATAMEDSPALDNAKNVFAKLIKEKASLGQIQGDLEGYRYALQTEAQGVKFYEDAAKREKNSEVKKLLLRIAEEEKKHFNIIQNVYDFVNAPNEFLAWGEFSNIEEYKQFGRDVD
ncbi:ferritin [Desulfuromonas versatilis]|uniref:Ferritin n=1 Tax=Desulfuromonas versatilis TaxID=2802975 RepID=A0ABN6DYN3_9BACT|nr:ferritin family protein [Desulfuromonas versatilis]BCR05140.1 ferritin [Desulfuromonas versatilis]